MYQLSHMITEQKNILQTLSETSILGDKVPLSVESASANDGKDAEVKEKADKDEDKDKQ